MPDLASTNVSPRKKAFRKHQPFWNGELESLWFSVSQAEKNFVKIKVTCNPDIDHMDRAK